MPKRRILQTAPSLRTTPTGGAPIEFSATTYAFRKLGRCWTGMIAPVGRRGCSVLEPLRGSWGAGSGGRRLLVVWTCGFDSGFELAQGGQHLIGPRLAQRFAGSLG